VITERASNYAADFRFSEKRHENVGQRAQVANAQSGLLEYRETSQQRRAFREGRLSRLGRSGFRRTIARVFVQYRRARLSVNTARIPYNRFGSRSVNGCADGPLRAWAGRGTYFTRYGGFAPTIHIYTNISSINYARKSFEAGDSIILFASFLSRRSAH